MKARPSQLERYAATAILVRPGDAFSEVVTQADDPSFLLARSPLAAARIWYWRLNEFERALCVRVVVSAWPYPHADALPAYSGPGREFSPKHGWRELRGRREQFDLSRGDSVVNSTDI